MFLVLLIKTVTVWGKTKIKLTEKLIIVVWSHNAMHYDMQCIMGRRKEAKSLLLSSFFPWCIEHGREEIGNEIAANQSSILWSYTKCALCSFCYIYMYSLLTCHSFVTWSGIKSARDIMMMITNHDNIPRIQVPVFTNMMNRGWVWLRWDESSCQQLKEKRKKYFFL